MEYKEPVNECPCGNSSLSVVVMRLELRGIPVHFTDDGPQYDDTQAEYSEGWDYNDGNQDRVECRNCKRVFTVCAPDTFEVGYLKEVQPEEATK